MQLNGLFHRLGFFLLSLFFSVAFTAPLKQPIQGELVTRAGNGDGSAKSNAKEITLDVAGWKDTAEEDCYAMLCLEGQERTWRKIDTPDLRKTHYTNSGAASGPFKKQNLTKFGTAQIDSAPGAFRETNSAKEFPMESMAQGGSGATLFPTTARQQRVQGARFKNALREAGVADGQWFRFTFTGDIGKFCKALQQDPPDTSVCRDPTDDLFGKKDVDISKFAWVAVKDNGQRSFHHPKSSKRSTLMETRSFEAEENSRLQTNPKKANGIEVEDSEAVALDARPSSIKGEDSIPLEERDANFGEVDDMKFTEEDLDINKP